MSRLTKTGGSWPAATPVHACAGARRCGRPRGRRPARRARRTAPRSSPRRSRRRGGACGRTAASRRAAASSSPRIASPSRLTLTREARRPASGDVAGERRVLGGDDDAAASRRGCAGGRSAATGPRRQPASRWQPGAARRGRRAAAPTGGRPRRASRSWAIERAGVGVRSTSSVRANSSSRPAASPSRRPSRRARRRSRQVVVRSASTSRRAAARRRRRGRSRSATPPLNRVPCEAVARPLCSRATSRRPGSRCGNRAVGECLIRRATRCRCCASSGDLVEDVVVRLSGPPARGTDTPAVVERTTGRERGQRRCGRGHGRVPDPLHRAGGRRSRR